jgi:hypothetical protein
MADWSNFFRGELGAAAALAMLLPVIIVASLPLIPGQPPRLLGGEVAVVGLATLLGLIPVQRGYHAQMTVQHRRRSGRMIIINRFAVLLVASVGAVLLRRGDVTGLYLLPVGILMIFTAVGFNARVLLIEINR